MKNKGSKYIVYLVTGALIAALYTALTQAAAAAGIAYGAVQFRFSEAMTVLAAFTPAAIPGLTIGCFLGNLGSPFGMVDIVCGTLATFLAAVCSYATRKVCIKKLPVLAPLFPVLFNAVIVGLEIAYFMPEGLTFTGFLIAALEVGAGELVVCYALGLPLAAAIQRTKLDKMLNFTK